MRSAKLKTTDEEEEAVASHRLYATSVGPGKEIREDAVVRSSKLKTTVEEEAASHRLYAPSIAAVVVSSSALHVLFALKEEQHSRLFSVEKMFSYYYCLDCVKILIKHHCESLPRGSDAHLLLTWHSGWN